MTAADLSKRFQQFGKIIEAKVVLDDEGHSKRFGFISFATVKEAERVLERSVIYMHGQKINVGPAVRKEVRQDFYSVK